MVTSFGPWIPAFAGMTGSKQGISDAWRRRTRKNKTRMPKGYGLMQWRLIHGLLTRRRQVGNLGLQPLNVGFVQVEVLGLGMVKNHGGY